ncbi:MAG: hypothetical protein HQK59_13445 [Deltaproteobacteria bacterium]|nr:hypothetical protein [Deltaproteobacteria bacterium]
MKQRNSMADDTTWRQIGRLELQSGYVMIMDPAFVGRQFTLDTFDDCLDRIDPETRSCQLAAHGVASGLGLIGQCGTGTSRPVYARYRHGRISELKIVIEENDQS